MKTIKEEQPAQVRNHRAEKEILNELVDRMFAEDSGSMADVLAELTGKSYEDFPDELCRKYFNLLGRNIIFDALKWGLSDTEVRDSIYSHFKSFGVPDEKDL